jgi:hypothetical protein
MRYKTEVQNNEAHKTNEAQNQWRHKTAEAQTNEVQMRQNNEAYFHRGTPMRHKKQ